MGIPAGASKALIDMGIEYETVLGAPLPWQRDKRAELIQKTGGDRYPAIELEDGSVYREESKDMEKAIRAGKLFEKSAGTAAATSVTPESIGESSLE